MTFDDNIFLYKLFVPKAAQLYTRMVTQGRNKASILFQYPKIFSK